MLPAFNIAPLLRGIGNRDKLVSFRKKQVIFSHGDMSDSIFYIDSGIAKLTITSLKGKEALVSIVAEGDFFGESSLLSSRPVRFHTATAVTEMRVRKIDRAQMIRTLRMQPEIACDLISYLLRRYHALQREFADSLLQSSGERLDRVLTSLGRGGGNKGKFVVLSQQDLANMVGITRQRVNVLLKQLRKSGRKYPV